MSDYELHRHHLAQFDTLKVDPEVLERRYSSACAMANCRGGCCRGGADVDVMQRDRILGQSELIRGLMSPHRDAAPQAWFGEAFEDSDFPSGTAASTCVIDGACVFLQADGRCVLHRAEALAAPGTGELKPFFCRAYPLTIEAGVLVIDDLPCPGQTACCGAVPAGPLSLFEVCAEELEFVLGRAGLDELAALAGRTCAKPQVSSALPGSITSGL